ncbi:MAG: LamG domain-containing protein [Armatimonadota bacterium]|nr:LamG domain-containing protein [Armatimonadota bacterium]
MNKSWSYLSLGVLSLASGMALVSLAQDTPPDAQNCIAPPPGLVGWWPGNADANDLTDKNNGRMHGAATLAAGHVGQAFSFGGQDSVLHIPASEDLDVGRGPGLTIEAWLNPKDVLPYHPVMEWNNGQNFGTHLWIFEGSGALYAMLMDVGGMGYKLSTPAGTLKANTWQHIALTYDKMSGVGRIYVNGAVVVEKMIGRFRPQTTWDFFVGMRPSANGGVPYVGLMDEIALYNRALTAREVQAIFDAGASGKCPPGTTSRAVTAQAPAPAAPTAPATTTPTITTPAPAAIAPPPTPAPTPIPTPTPLPTPTPRPMVRVPALPETQPLAVFDFTVPAGIDTALGRKAADDLSQELRDSKLEVKTRQQIALAAENNLDLQPPYSAAAQKRLAAEAGAQTYLSGKIVSLTNTGKSARIEIEVRQWSAATGNVIDVVKISEKTLERSQPVPAEVLMSEVIHRAIAAAVRYMKQSRK